MRMGQREVLDFLNDQGEISDRFFTVRDIQKGLQDRGFSNGVLKNVHKNITRLILCNEIEWRGKGYWKHHKEFRSKQVRKKG